MAVPSLLSFVLLLNATATAADPSDAAIRAAVRNCRTVIQNCQLPDGAIRVKAEGQPVWINVYFGHHAALAILAAHSKYPDESAIGVVEKWLTWCARNQREDGSFDDFEGTLSQGYKSNGKRDSVDSYCAFYLLVADRYRQAGGKPSTAIIEAARMCVKGIESIVDPADGLTFAKKEYKVKYLMDNCEVYGGLSSGSKFFASVGDKDTARKAGQLAARIAKALPDYWRGTSFAYARFENGNFEADDRKIYPGGLCQLYALAWVDSGTMKLWQTLNKQFSAEQTPHAAVGVERFLIAASKCGTTADREHFQKMTIRSAAGFTNTNVYVHRPALSVLALLEGSDWLPNVANASK